MSPTTHHHTGEALPRPLITIGVPCAGALLIAFFMIRGFPYDKLGDWIANRIEQNNGIQLAIGYIGPTLQLAGPALEATQLRAKAPDRPPQQIDRALIRPAWSLSWLAGEPAFHMELEGAAGYANGTLRWNGAASWVGFIRDARPELPPIADWIPTGRLEGILEATIDISLAELGPEGVIEFTARDGSIFLPGLPGAPLPFESLTGVVNLGGDAYAKLASLKVEGPDVTGSGSGKIGRAERLEQAPIGFEFDFVVGPVPGTALRGGGVTVHPGGEALAKISGTVAKPKVR